MTLCEGSQIEVDTKDSILTIEPISDNQFVSYSANKIRLWDLRAQDIVLSA